MREDGGLGRVPAALEGREAGEGSPGDREAPGKPRKSGENENVDKKKNKIEIVSLAREIT